MDAERNIEILAMIGAVQQGVSEIRAMLARMQGSLEHMEGSLAELRAENAARDGEGTASFGPLPDPLAGEVETDGEISKAYQVGLKDHRDGRNENPYPHLTPSRSAWELGWNHAFIQAKRDDG